MILNICKKENSNNIQWSSGVGSSLLYFQIIKNVYIHGNFD